MIIELRKKSQLTLPKDVVKKLNLKEGDKLSIEVKNGSIVIEPVAVYPKEYIYKLHEEIMLLKEDSKIEDYTFTNIEELTNSLKNK
jgi:AbrB family looped-hinge helix DNA binding protein